MVQVNESLTKKIADLSRLELTENEVHLFTQQLGNIIKYIELLQEVDVTDVEPMVHPLEIMTPMREDVVRPSPLDDQGKPKVLISAPDTLYDGFKVPPIL